MSKPLQLRLRYGANSTTLSLPPQSSVGDLRRHIERLSGVASRAQVIAIGLPPKPLILNNDNVALTAAGILTQSTLTVTQSAAAAPLSIIRCADDNSCLFHAVATALSNRRLVAPAPSADGIHLPVDASGAHRYRELVVRHIRAHPQHFDSATLGDRTVDEYCTAMSSTAWGGAIECAIIADCERVQIAAVDVETSRVYVFGELHPEWQRRVYLLYSGIHYDLLADAATNITTVFRPDDVSVMERALLTAKTAASQHAYTNPTSFTLRCSVCGTGIVGAQQASQHASATKHTAFEEYTTT